MNKRKPIFYIEIILFIIFYFAFTLYTVPVYRNVRAYFEEKSTANNKVVTINGNLISVEIADTEEKRTRGLSDRESLESDTGLLFIFEKKGKNNFWMKDMNFNIDIIWFDENFKAIYFVENATPQSYPKLFGTSKESKFVLEVPAGYIKLIDLKIGDKIDL